MFGSLGALFEPVGSIICYVAMGCIIKRKGILRGEALGYFHRFIFYFALPLLQFKNVYECDLAKSFDLKLLLYMNAMVVIMMLTAMAAVRRYVRSRERRGIIVQAVVRGNAIAFGMPVVLMICPETYVGKVAITYSLMFPIINIVSIAVLQWYKTNPGKMTDFLKKTLLNPIFLGAVAGAVLNGLGISVAKILYDPIKSIGAMGAPLAFIVLGASFDKFSAHRDISTVSMVLLMKLVVVPAICITIGYFLIGLRNEQILALTGFFATPCEVSSVSTARAMGYDDILMEEVVAYSTVIGCITISAWIAGLTALGLI